MDICRDILAYVMTAQSRDVGNGWFQYLPIIIIAGLWVLGVILKAVRKQSEDDDEKAGRAGEEPAELNLSQLVELARRHYAGEYRPAEQQPKQGRSPAAVPPVIPIKRASRPGSRAAVQQGSLRRPAGKQTPQRYAGRPGEKKRQEMLGNEIKWVQPNIEPLSEISEPTFKDLSAAHKVQTSRRRLSDILDDFSGRDSLKRAILHYEILGKCVAMRKPQGSGVWT